LAIPGKEVVPADFIDLAYHPPKTVTRALVSSNCRSPRFFHPAGDPQSVILRSFYDVARAAISSRRLRPVDLGAFTLLANGIASASNELTTVTDAV
jgi:hypothetical protein